MSSNPTGFNLTTIEEDSSFFETNTSINDYIEEDPSFFETNTSINDYTEAGVWNWNPYRPANWYRPHTPGAYDDGNTFRGSFTSLYGFTGSGYRDNIGPICYGSFVAFASLTSFLFFWYSRKKALQEGQTAAQTGDSPVPEAAAEPNEGPPPSYVEVVESNSDPPPSYNEAARSETNNHKETRWRFYDSWSARRDRMRAGRTAQLGSRDSSVAVVHINEPPTVHGEQEQRDTGNENNVTRGPRTLVKNLELRLKMLGYRDFEVMQ